ncbi:MAG: serine/threonine-protein kinase [Planctomycetota bacterium]
MRIARKGGFGVVFEAMDSNLRTKVWISAYEGEDEAWVEEAAQDAAGLDHAHILRIDEIDREEPWLYYRTRTIDGTNLLEKLHSAPAGCLPVAETRLHVRQILAAIQFAHGHGVVHGDLHPLSILFDRDDRLRVSDFRISRAVRDAGGIAAQQPYRAPEEMTGSAASPEGDLFSLGCIAYQLLTGRLPYPPRSPRDKPPTPLPDHVPIELRRLVETLLATDPATRSPDAEKIAEALDPEPADATNGNRKLSFPLSVAALVVSVAAFLFVLMSGDSADKWDKELPLLLAEERFPEAIARLRKQMDSSPEIARPLLARTLFQQAERHERDGALWAAQRCAEEAHALDPRTPHQEQVRRLRTRTLARLGLVRVVRHDPATGEVRIDLAGVPVQRVNLGGVQAKVRDGFAIVRLENGRNEVEMIVIDAAGNERRESLRWSDDRSALTPAHSGD